MEEMTLDEKFNYLKDLIKRLINKQGKLKVLDVGCGCGEDVSAKELLADQDTHIAGIDIAQNQLDKNPYIDEAINCDISVYDFAENEYDIIVCWGVLEHIPDPVNAAKNCFRSLKENGLAIIMVPYVYSPKALIAKFTPQWFHVWIYKKFLKYENAGKPGFPPFPTTMKFSISPSSIQKMGRSFNVKTEFIGFFETPNQVELRQRNIFMQTIWGLLKFIVWIFSLGKLNINHTDYTIILRKLKA